LGGQLDVGGDLGVAERGEGEERGGAEASAGAVQEVLGECGHRRWSSTGSRGRSRGSGARGSGAALEAGEALLEVAILLVELDGVEGELLDFGEEFGLHFAEADAVVADFGFGGDAGEVVVLLDVGGDFGEGFEAVGGVEDVVGPAGGGHDDFLGGDGAVDGELGGRVSGADAYWGALSCRIERR